MIKNNFKFDIANILKKADLLLFLLFVIFCSFVMLRSFYPYWDSLGYHLPFASRLAGIYDKESFSFLPHLENFYSSWPLLPFAIEGFFWKITNNISSVALLNVLAIIIFSLYVNKKLGIPRTVSVLFLLSTPLSFLSYFSYYYDFFVCTFIALCFLNVYLIISGKNERVSDYITLMLFLFIGSNSKYTVLPVVFVIYFVLIAYLFFKKKKKWLISFVVLSPLIFLNQTQNLIRFHDPVYPMGGDLVKSYLGSKDGFENTFDGYGPKYLNGRPGVVKFVYSILEIKAYDSSRPARWVIDQGSVPFGSDGFRMGGFFFVNQLFWWLVVVFSLLRKNRKIVTLYTTIFVVFVYLLTSFIPISHELRYFQYLSFMLFILVFIATRHFSTGSKVLLYSIQFVIFSFVAINLRGSVYIPKAGFSAYNIESYAKSDKVCLYNLDSRYYFLYRLGTPDKIKIESENKVEDCSYEPLNIQ